MITLFDRVSFREFATNVQRTQKCFSWCKSHLRSGLIKTFFRLKISRNGRVFDVPRNGTGANKAFLQQRKRERERVIVAISQRLGSLEWLEKRGEG